MSKHSIGVFAACFDPIQLGHVQMGLYALDHFGLDHLLIIPVSGFPCDAALQDRWAMIVAACSADERLLPFLPESESGEVFSSAFLAILKKRFPKSSFAYLPPPCSDPAAASLSLRLSLLDKKVLAVPDSAISPSSAENFSSFLNPAVHEYCRCKRLYDFSSPLSRGPAWVDALFHSLKPRRFAHSLSVALTALKLANRFSLDPSRAEAAGLLHDCAKALPLCEMQRLAHEYHITEDETILASGALLHSLVGAFLARRDFGMEDPEILDAITYHNTGFPGMSRLAMAINLADYMEPLRDPIPALEPVRHLAEISLEQALLLSLESTAAYVQSKDKFLHPRTVETIAWLKTLPETADVSSQF